MESSLRCLGRIFAVERVPGGGFCRFLGRLRPGSQVVIGGAWASLAMRIKLQVVAVQRARRPARATPR